MSNLLDTVGYCTGSLVSRSTLLWGRTTSLSSYPSGRPDESLAVNRKPIRGVLLCTHSFSMSTQYHACPSEFHTGPLPSLLCAVRMFPTALMFPLRASAAMGSRPKSSS